MTDKNYVCMVTQADEYDGDLEIRARALIAVTTWDAQDAAMQAAGAWDDGNEGDKSDTLDDPLFVEVQEAGSSEPPKRYRVSSVLRRDYSSTEADADDVWPPPFGEAEEGGAS